MSGSDGEGEGDEYVGSVPSMVSLSQHAMQPATSIAPYKSSSFGEEVVAWHPNKKSKVVNDPIHGYMRFDPDIVGFIDTRQFQRLRDLKQLGTTYLVFPGASHNRFEHSLGVAHLADNWLSHLGRVHADEALVSDTDKKLVTLAGLVHDLGHGPFSHVFDNEVMPAVCPQAHFTHEQMSCKMFDWMVDDYAVDISKEHQDCVKALILGSKHGTAPGYLRNGRMFLYDVVANSRNGIDVDKFDYIPRDSISCNVKASCDFTRIWQSSKVIDDEICFHEKEVHDLYDLFHARASLHKRVYTHTKAKALEYMVRDVLVESALVLRLAERVQSAEEYYNLTDCVLREIEGSRGDELAPARKLIKRIRDRDLYKFCGEFVVPSGDALGKQKATPEDIASHNTTPGIRLEPRDVIVHNLEINYGLRDDQGNAANPIDHCNFFNDWHAVDKFPINREKVGPLLVPNTFSEKTIRVFCRSPDPAKQHAVGRALQQYARSLRCPSPNLTPTKKRRRQEDRPSPPPRLDLFMSDV